MKLETLIRDLFRGVTPDAGTMDKYRKTFARFGNKFVSPEKVGAEFHYTESLFHAGALERLERPVFRRGHRAGTQFLFARAFALLVFFSLASFANAADPIRPDAKLTPGDVRHDVTIEQLCTRGYANVIDGGARHVTKKVKRATFVAYFGSVPAHPGDYEIDHLISLELGGSNDPKNLWPESYSGPWNARVKDRIENYMAAAVRHALRERGSAAANALLHRFQHEIATDWIAAFKKYLGSTDLSFRVTPPSIVSPAAAPVHQPSIETAQPCLSHQLSI